MTETVTVAHYLAARLRQLGVEHLFGVPGDFALTLLDEMTQTLQWVGSPNELNAGYAADGYARTRGLAAMVTTFGVGELSALNAIAGAYCEHAPVVQITGAPATTTAANGTLTHHTLADGDFTRFARAYTEVTADGAVLRADVAAEQIDNMLATALRELRPVYLSVPVDVATAPVSKNRLHHPLPKAYVDTAAIERFRKSAATMLHRADSAVVVAGHVIERTRSQQALSDLARKAASPVVTLISARGAFDETDPLFAGVYCGEIGSKSAIVAVETADVVLEIGTLMADAVTGMFSHRDDPVHTIKLDVTKATVGGVTYPVPFAIALEVLTSIVPSLEREVPATEPRQGAYQTLDQLTLWSRLESWLPADSRLVTDIGTTFWGSTGISLKKGTDVVAQPVWSSIGYSVPATLGCALADPTRRPVLVVGDGAAQMTVQELGNLARLTNAIVVVVDNAGYTIERVLQSPQATYNDVAAWDWCALAHAFAPGVAMFTARPTTLRELDAALTVAAARTDRMSVIHVRLDPMDVPAGLQGLADMAARR